MSQAGNFKKFEDDPELNNKNINLNESQQGNAAVSSQSQKKGQPAFMKKMVEKKEDMVVAMVLKDSNISEQMSSAVMNKINGHLSFVGKYFNVEVDDIKEKLIASIIPGNKNFHTLAEATPDLYGPFWIYTTLIFLVTFAGNLSNYINAEGAAQENFKYNFNFIPNAAIFIYGVGFGIPLVLYILMKFMFKVDIPLVLNICVYGYSFTSLAPVLILCIIPNTFLETLFLLYFLGASSYFLLFNMANFIFEKAQASKNIILGILLFIQIALFLTLKFYFFATFTNNK